MKLVESVRAEAYQLASRAMAARTVVRRDNVQFRMRVTGVRMLGTAMRRITFAAPELRTFELTGPDEYFGLLMPGANGSLVLPPDGRRDVRAAIAEMPAEVAPGLRWYTIRAHRPELAEIDVDIVGHEVEASPGVPAEGEGAAALHTAGAGWAPGARWAAAATVGDEAGFRGGGSCYHPGGSARRRLLVADETALPALAAILESDGSGWPAEDVEVHIEVPSVAAVGAESLPAGVSVHERGGAEPGALVLPALQARLSAGQSVDYAWVCGESGLITAGRRLLVDAGVDRRRILFSGYWKLGSARG